MPEGANRRRTPAMLPIHSNRRKAVASAGVTSVRTVVARRCSELEQVEAGERVVDLLHSAACRQATEVDRGESGFLK